MTVMIENERLIAVVEEQGAELVSLLHKASGRECLWSGDPAFWPRRAPVLFPVVGKLRDDSFRVFGKSYKMPQHGFARDSVFLSTRKDGGSAGFRLGSSDASLARYPFEFSLSLNYVLEMDSLRVEARVENQGCSAMPFSIGFHPAFACPFFEGERLDQYAVLFEGTEECRRLILADGLISGEEPFHRKDGKLALSEGLFSKDALVLEGLGSKKASLGRKDGAGPKIEVSFEGFPYLGIWKKSGARFVCIEPWHGVHDRPESGGDIFSKEGTIVLGPGGSFNCGIAISCYQPRR